jgi:ribosome-associated translation inhibitor RaiA
MIRLNFHNLDRSELAKEAVEDSLAPVLEQFPFVNVSQIWVSLSTENSSSTSEPDFFRVNMRLAGGVADGISVTAVASSLFVALSGAARELTEGLEKISDRANRRTSSG